MRQVDAVEENQPGIGFKEARKKLEEYTFACPTLPKVNVFQPCPILPKGLFLQDHDFQHNSDLQI